MTVRIGSARISEKGTINGKLGDQKNGMEVSTQSWYNHKKGWYILRAKDRKKAELIARNMEAFCNNDHFGYGQSDRSTAYTACKAVGWDASKVKKDCNTDCSMTVRICCLYAGIQAGPFSTLSEVDVLKKTGAFDLITDDKICSNADYWKRGDIGVTRTKGHTVVALTSGSKTATKKMTVKTTGSSLRLRKSPVDGETIVFMKNGSDVIPTGNTQEIKGSIWYEVTYKKYTGWASGNCLK